MLVAQRVRCIVAILSALDSVYFVVSLESRHFRRRRRWG